jgi:pimeloyl-ACP methyl ester carboxylesterase
MLSPYFHIIAPDYLGSGYSERPNPVRYRYTFDKLAEHTHALIKHLKIKKYALYMQDFGAPVGFRLMMKHPEMIDGIISQNANAYLDGLVQKRQQFFLKANKDRSPKHVAKMENWVRKKAIINGQYLRDVSIDRHNIISPDAWTHDLRFLQTSTDRKIQVQLFQDYQSNIDQYPKWQKLMRKHQFPALIIWGRNDIAFIADGARAYLRDLPKAKLVLLDAGHFAVEEKPSEVASYVYDFVNSL